MTRTRTPALVASIALVIASCGGGNAQKLELSYSETAARDSKGELAGDAPLIYGPQATYEWAGGEKPEPGDAVQAWKFTAPKNPVSALEKITSALTGRRARVLPQVGSPGSYTAALGEGISFNSYGDENARWWSLAGSESVEPGSSSEACAPDGSTGDGSKCGRRTVDTVPPAENLIPEKEAVDRARRILGSVDVPDELSTVTYTSSKDDWYTNVYATFVWQGQPTSMGWYFAWGENGGLQNAGGPVFGVEKTGTYAVITVDEAIERLNKGLGWSYPVLGWGATKDIALPPGTSTSSDPVPVAPADTTATTTVPAVVRVTKAERSLVQWWVGSGVQMLLPAWTLTSDSGSAVQVVAVPDRYVTFQVPEDRPTGTVPDGGSPGSGSSGGASENTGAPDSGQPIALADAEKLLGLEEADAEKLAAGYGWAWRVTMRDGEFFQVTADYQPRRVNVEITKGVITAITVG